MFEADDCLGAAVDRVAWRRAAASDWVKPRAVSRPESAVTEIVFASPVTLPESTSLQLTTEA